MKQKAPRDYSQGASFFATFYLISVSQSLLYIKIINIYIRYIFRPKHYSSDGITYETYPIILFMSAEHAFALSLIMLFKTYFPPVRTHLVMYIYPFNSITQCSPFIGCLSFASNKISPLL